MVSDAFWRMCTLLPIPLIKCTCCGGGIRQSRGFTWWNPKAIINSIPALDDRCSVTTECALVMCPKEIERAGLLWIGKRYYPSQKGFLREAKEMGLSRRIPALPRDFKIGNDVVFLAHPEAVYVSSVADESDDAIISHYKQVAPELFEGKRPLIKQHAEVLNWWYMPAAFLATAPRVQYVIDKEKDTEKKIAALVKKGVELVDVQREQMEIVYEGSDE